MAETSSNFLGIPASLWPFLLQAGGAGLSTYGQGKSSAADRAAGIQRDQAQLPLQYAIQRLGAQEGFLNRDQQALAQALSSLGSPLEQQAARQKMGLQREFLFGGAGGRPQYVGPAAGSGAARYFDASKLPSFQGAQKFFTDDAMQAGEMPYWDTMGQLTGGRIQPKLGAAYGETEPNPYDAELAESGAARAGELAAEREGAYGMLDSAEARSQAALQQALKGQKDEKKDKSSWWKKLLGPAVGIAGAAFGLPTWALIGLGAGTGAATGGLEGAVGGGLGAFLGGKLPIPKIGGGVSGGNPMGGFR